MNLTMTYTFKPEHVNRMSSCVWSEQEGIAVILNSNIGRTRD